MAPVSHLGMTAGALRATVVLLILSLLLAAGNLLFTSTHVQRDEQRWCAVINDLAATAMGRQQVTDLRELATQFGCRKGHP